MSFIREIGREEMYIKYVHQLVNVGIETTSLSCHLNPIRRLTCNLKTTWRLP